MDITELFRSAFLAIRTNKSRSFLTTLGIVIGVAAVITLVSIGTGIQNFVTEQFQRLGSDLLFVQPGRVNFRGGGRPATFTPKFTFDDVRNLNRAGGSIEGASASIFRASLAEYKRETMDVSISGVGANYLDLIQGYEINTGRWFTQSMEDRAQAVVIVGAKVPDQLVRDQDALGKQITISDKKFTIIGVLKSAGTGIGGGDQDSMVYMPITTAKNLLGEKSPGSITIKARDNESVSRAGEQAKQYFYRRGLTDDDFTILEPTQILSTINTFLGAITGALSGIAAISLVVGGVGIANIMLVSVTERTREIGLRKALGARKNDILLQFLIEAVVLSAFGGLIGIVLGWGLSMLISKFIETAVTMQSVLLAFGISCLVGIVSGFTPALRAARLNPIDALRYE